MNDELTEDEMTKACFANLYSPHNEEIVKEILKGTGLSIRNGVVYRDGKEVATVSVTPH